MGFYHISEHVESLFARLAAVCPSSLWWRSAVVVHRWKCVRGAEEIISEYIEGSCVFRQGQSLAWMRLCPCGDNKDGLLRFLLEEEVAWDCSLKTKSFSLCAGLQRQRKSLHLHDHGWDLFLTISELHGFIHSPPGYKVPSLCSTAGWFMRPLVRLIARSWTQLRRYWSGCWLKGERGF